MPKKRQPKEQWRQVTRLRIVERDEYKCTHCTVAVAIDTGHVDHIQSGKLASNEDWNLRTLCRRCHVLRADNRHRGMISKALRDGVIPPNWRELVWE